MNNIRKLTNDTSQVFNAVQDSLAIIDTQFNVININTTYLKLLKKDVKEVIGKKCYTVLRGSRCRTGKCPLKKIIRKTEVIEIETEKHFPDGSRVPLILTATPLISDHGKLTGMIQSFKDITDFKLSSKKLERVLDEVIKALSVTVEVRDPYTFGHQERVAQISEKIAREMGFSETRVKALWMAATIHDIGKIYVPSEFLAKPTKLTEIEFAVIKTHSFVGYSIIKNIDFDWPIAEIVYQHHEKMDGSGYPLGVSGEKILMEARILTVADVVEAMSSHRPYRPALGLDKAKKEIKKNKETFYDPDVVDVCLQVIKEKGLKIFAV